MFDHTKFFLDSISQPIDKSPVHSGNAEQELSIPKPISENIFPVPEAWNPYPEGEMEKHKTTRSTTTTTTTTTAPTTPPPTTAGPTTAPPTTSGPTTGQPTIVAPTTPPQTTTTPCPSKPQCLVPISDVCPNIDNSSVPAGSTIYSLCDCTEFQIIQDNKGRVCHDVISNRFCDPKSVQGAEIIIPDRNAPRIIVADCDAFQQYVIDA